MFLPAAAPKDRCKALRSWTEVRKDSGSRSAQGLGGAEGHKALCATEKERKSEMREVVHPCWAIEVLCHVQNIIISFRPKTCVPSPKPQSLAQNF